MERQYNISSERIDFLRDLSQWLNNILKSEKPFNGGNYIAYLPQEVDEEDYVILILISQELVQVTAIKTSYPLQYWWTPKGQVEYPSHFKVFNYLKESIDLTDFLSLPENLSGIGKKMEEITEKYFTCAIENGPCEEFLDPTEIEFLNNYSSFPISHLTIKDGGITDPKEIIAPTPICLDGWD